jgi:hypothetical protein
MNSLLRRLYHEQRGQVLYLAAMAVFVILGMAALSIDIGFVLHAQRELQVSADAAATAGALDLSNDLPAGTAIATANSTSGIAGGKNAYMDLPNVTMVSGYPAVACIASMVALGMACDNAASANAVAVQETVNAPTFFGKLFGITSIKLTASSLAAMKSGTPTPANIMVIVDTTGSMSTTDTKCASATGISNPSRLDCSKYGVRTLLLGLAPCPTGAPCGAATNGNVPNPVDEVGILTFPGLVNTSDAKYDYTNCGKSMSQSYINGYAAPPTTPPVYTIVPPSSDYKLSDSSTTLNGSPSDLVDAVDWTNGVGCSENQYGLQNPAGKGTYYAGVITEAQNDLSALPAPRSSVQSAIIILSDGAANSTKNDFISGTPSSYYTNDCAQAVTAAQNDAATTNAAGLHTWVYAVAYGSSTATGAGSQCTTDSSGISACQAMTEMASDPNKFYSDDADGCLSAAHPTMTGLGQIFTNISNQFVTTRLLPFSLYVP